jgi:hypothetical protein
MQKRLLPQILMMILCANLFFACAAKKKVDPYVLSVAPQIQALEKQDHQFCSSLKLDFDKRDNSKSELYWRCRLSLTKYRLYINDNSPAAAMHNEQINELMGKISLNIAKSPEVILLRENRKMDDRDHKKCVAMGFEVFTADQAKVDDYFACRKALIEDQKVVPAFGNTDYLQYSNDTYNIGFAIDRRIDEEIKRYNEAQIKYPTCVKYNLYTIDYKNCTAAQDSSRQCFSEITRKKFAKEAEEKITCQKKAYIQFPEEFLKESERSQTQIDKMRVTSDYYNRRSFSSIGISDVSKFDADAERVKKQKEAQKKAININSKEGLYTKFELTKLRQNFVFSCQKEADFRIVKYVADLSEGCAALVIFKEMGTD